MPAGPVQTTAPAGARTGVAAVSAHAHCEDQPLKCPPLTGGEHLYEVTAYTDTSGRPHAPEPDGPTDTRTLVRRSIQSRQRPEVSEGFEATHSDGIPKDSTTRRTRQSRIAIQPC
jgi:hypothetical protein